MNLIRECSVFLSDVYQMRSLIFELTKRDSKQRYIGSFLGLFVKDITHVVSILLRLCFWFTPIFWHLDMMPESTRVYFKISPIFYLVQGYRETFIYHKPFWDQPLHMLYFWAFSTAIFVTGVVVFKRLRPHFAEVL